MFTLGKVLISTRGLAPGNYHFYMNAKPSVAMVQGEMCQCPLGLIPHFYRAVLKKAAMIASGCQCPLGLIPHFYLCKIYIFQSLHPVSMPSRAYTSFLRSPFKNLDFMRFSEPVFAGIYQNILITAVFRAC